MRADRLLAALLFLQTRDLVTAAELAAELEVSERTARRDLEALAAAGVPVYSQAGKGGGWRLVGGARTDLSGLTAPEIRELFLLTGPESATTPRTRAALRKLVRALPAPLRPGAEAAARAALTDTTDWTGTGAEPALLDALREAVVDAVRLRIGYARPGREPAERLVHPLGIAAKAGVPYLVADTAEGLRTFRVSRVTSVTPTREPAVRPPDFDLATAWRTLTARMEDRMLAATVRGRAAPGTEGVLEGLFGGRIRYVADGHDEADGADGADEADAEGWRTIEVDGPSPGIVAAQLAGLGARVELLAPPEARTALARIGAELGALYGPGSPGSPEDPVSPAGPAGPAGPEDPAEGSP
ncbi:helix-turn-helix transcriptional regulator [Streptomyces sp. NPDC013740]|uniref:helix-turn-helix transcriptional regulator n=1 Tax=Streptomyces sp. NPDC013740 TaxID=3364867 RepID=UPI003703198C